MQKNWKAEDRRRLLLCLIILGLTAALFILPHQFSSLAGGKQVKKGLFQQTKSHEDGIENYDIRNEIKSEEVGDAFAKYRERLGKDSALVADIRGEFVRGEEELKSRIPTVKVEYNSDIRTPEVITPDVWKDNIEWLSPATSASMKRSEILRNFIKQNNSLTGVTDEQADNLRVTADYTNPNGYMSFAHLEQFIGGVPVFRGEVKAGFTKDGRIIRVINNLAPGLDYNSLSTDFRNPADAVRAAAGVINYELKSVDTTPNAAASNDLKTVFGEGDWATTAEKMYFPTEPGVAVPAWRVLIWKPVNAYYVIVDAENGRMLWRKNISADQTQSATYQIYRNANSFIGAADSPSPLSPGPLVPTTNQQGVLGTRSNVTFIGNEGTSSFNNNGWITDGANITDGNNLEAGIDRDGTNGVDAPVTGSPNRIFDSTWNPPPGNPAPGDEPLTAQAQRGAVIQMFYVMNRYHDLTYQLGFTEAARNFQGTNFTGQGVGNDRVSAEGQDSSGTNNANFGTVADGGRGRMQMFLWTGPTPDYDGTGDAEVIIHEVTHGTSNRLHGNASGLSTNMSGGMGEGWGDFFGYSMLAEPSDPINGVYTTGGYATFLLGGMQSNYYYGIRRFPRAPITFTGANGKPYNPFTFQYINANCDTLIGTTATNPNSAFPRNPSVSTSSATQACDQVHNLGEIWSSALWEVRNRMVTRLGFTPGTTRALQVVLDGMKLAPVGPTFLQERDSIIAAAAALPIAPEASADVFDVREGFRVRGMGFSASIQNAGTGGNNTAVTEAFDVPNAIFTNPTSVSDSTGDNDGFPEPGEVLSVNVPITNNSGGGTINTVVGSITGGGNANYGNIADGVTVVRQISYTVPAGAVCGSLHTITITGSSALGAMNPRTFTFRLGQPTFGASSQNFDGVTAPVLPAGFENNQISGTGINWVTTATAPSSAPNSAFANDPATLNDSALLTTAKINSATAQVSFKNKWTTESTFDGAVLEYSTDGNTWTDVCPSCAAICPGASCPFVSGGYTQTISTGFSSPIAGRRAWAGAQATYIDTVVNLPASLNGQTIGLRWRMASDVSVSSTGINIDDIVLTGGQFLDTYVCSIAPPTAVESRADFDNDGKTDLSVYRPAEGNWYLQQSTAGFGVIHWGVSSDVLTPGDFDGDNKTDFAVFRANADSTQPDFYILNSNGFTFSGVSWGLAGDIPVIRDYDGDDKEDIAVFRPSNNTWYILKSTGGITVTTFGQAGDVPVAGDFDGDGKGDLVVYRSGTWIGQLSLGGSLNAPFGAVGDVLVPADYDGDNKDDLAVFRPSSGQWIYQPSSGGAAVFTSWGIATDIPVPGDYDGDGKDDPAIYRNGQWWVLRSTGGSSTVNFGVAADKAIPKSYVP
ncbi:MAG TPA: M36 family metallopeptidase [Pyrinomonadaceae bacterium]|jgi:hypothetical protein